MTTKALIQSEIENVPAENLGELYEIVKRFAAASSDLPARKTGVLARLKQIKIEAPEDFAANLDHYASGEKSLADDSNLR